MSVTEGSHKNDDKVGRFAAGDARPPDSESAEPGTDARLGDWRENSPALERSPNSESGSTVSG